MIPGFGAHYRVYRLLVALDRLAGLPPGARLSLKRAAHMLGVSETNVRALIKRYAATDGVDGSTVDAAALRRAIRQAYEARKKR